MVFAPLDHSPSAAGPAAIGRQLALPYSPRRRPPAPQKERAVSATLASANLAAPLRPLAETAAQFRQECTALDHLIEELFRDVEQLREELVRKGDEIEEGRRKLAERGRLLAEQRKESGRLVSLLEQQESRAGETLTEVKTLREQVAREREESQQREATRNAFVEQKLRAIESERDQLKHELHVLQATAAASGGSG